MAEALHDLDSAVQAYQAGQDSTAPEASLEDPALAKPTNSATGTSSSAAQYDWEQFLLVSNPSIREWQDYFSGSGSHRLVTARNRLLPFRERTADILEKTGLPEDLIAVAFVESELADRAVSPQGATGPWQFMPATAARYGLEQGTRIDERTGFEKSTVAAARYLAHLYQLFGDWPLALAAYDAGEETVEAAIRKGNTRNFWQLSQQGLLPQETREYVPKVAAAARAWKAILPDSAARQSESSSATSADYREKRVYAVGSNDVGGGFWSRSVEVKALGE